VPLTPPQKRIDDLTRSFVAEDAIAAMNAHDEFSIAPALVNVVSDSGGKLL